MLIKKSLLALSLIFVFTPVLAFEADITQTYQLGDRDSKSLARDILLQGIKQAASDKAGVYIESDKSINSRGYEASVKTLSASIVKLSDVHETSGVNKNGSVFLTVSAHINIDDNLLKDRIRAIQSSKEKERKINRLSRENTTLSKKLVDLQIIINKEKLTPTEYGYLLGEQVALTNQLDRNHEDINDIFLSGGFGGLGEVSSARLKSDHDKKLYMKSLSRYRKAFREYYKSSVADNKPELVSVTQAGYYYQAVVRVKSPFKGKEEGLVAIFGDLKDREDEFSSLIQRNLKNKKSITPASLYRADLSSAEASDLTAKFEALAQLKGLYFYLGVDLGGDKRVMKIPLIEPMDDSRKNYSTLKNYFITGDGYPAEFSFSWVDRYIKSDYRPPGAKPDSWKLKGDYYYVTINLTPQESDWIEKPVITFPFRQRSLHTLN